MSSRMKLAFTDAITIDTSATLIQIGDTAGSGVIPNDVTPRAISVQPEDVSNDYYIRGIHNDSNWVKISNGQAFAMEGLTDETRYIMYVKSSTGSITLNIFVKGY